MGLFDWGRRSQDIDIPQPDDPKTKTEAVARLGVSVGRNSIRTVTGRGHVHDDPNDSSR
jgi:hypothetical protein